NEGLQTHVGIAEALLDLLDRLVELDLRVCGTEVPDALGVHEHDVLLAVREQPEDEVGMKVAGLEEAHPTALAQVAEQIELLVLEEVGMAVVEGFQILDEQALALVQRRRANLDNLRVKIQ